MLIFTVFLVLAFSSTAAGSAVVIRFRRFGTLLMGFLRRSTLRSPTATTVAATFCCCCCCCCLMVVLIPMRLLLLMMPLRHCREHLLTNGFGHRRHFDVPLCPLNSIPVVEVLATAAPGHCTLISAYFLSLTHRKLICTTLHSEYSTTLNEPD